MPDITMCKGDGCPMKHTCYRYTAKPSKYMQTFFTVAPFNRETMECEHYWLDVKTEETEEE